MTPFDLEPYLTTFDGWLPSQYVASLVWLAVAVGLGFLSFFALLIYKSRANKGAVNPLFFILFPIITGVIGFVSFYTLDNTSGMGRLYSYDYYKPAINEDLRDAVNEAYDLDLTTEQATTLKYNEIMALPLRPAIEYPTVDVPGLGTVKLEPIYDDDNGNVITGIGYENADGDTVELPTKEN